MAIVESLRSVPTSRPESPPEEIDLSVVIPVFNNAKTLDELLDRVIRVVEPLSSSFEVILVDDGSQDRSLAILRERAARDSRIRVFALVRNFGSQAAMCAALDQVRGKRLVSLDADLDNSPEDIPALLEPLAHGYDLVCGYRQQRVAPLFTRRLPSWLMNLYIRRQTGTRTRDLGCGMRALHTWIVRDLESEGEARRMLTPLILRRARRVTEVPIRSNAKQESGAHTFVSLAAMAMDYYLLTARRPFVLSGFVSAVALFAGAIVFLAGARLAGLIVLAGAWSGILLSLVGEYCQRLYQLRQGTPFYTLRNLERADE